MQKVQKRRTFCCRSPHLGTWLRSLRARYSMRVPCPGSPNAADASVPLRMRRSAERGSFGALPQRTLTSCFVPKRESIRADVLRRPRTHDGGSLHRHRRRRQRHIAWLETRMYPALLPLPTVAVFAPRSPPPPSASAHRLHIGVGVAMRQLARRSQERKYPNRPAPPCIQCVSLQYSWRTSLATALGAAVAFPAQPYALPAWFVVPCVATE